MSLPGLDRWYRFIKSHDRAELKAMLWMPATSC